LPLSNLSGDKSQDYFADGMTDELIGTLGRLGSLKVISRPSVMQFKESKKTTPEIAQTLHVDAILEGSVLVLPSSATGVQPGDQRVRINARLIRASTDHQLWERTFEAVVSDVLALQQQVAFAVADGINLKLSSQQQGILTRSRG